MYENIFKKTWFGEMTSQITELLYFSSQPIIITDISWLFSSIIEKLYKTAWSLVWLNFEPLEQPILELAYTLGLQLQQQPRDEETTTWW